MSQETGRKLSWKSLRTIGILGISLLLPALLRGLVLRYPRLIVWALGLGAPIVAGGLYTISLEGVVPVSCHVDGPAVTTISGGVIDLGTMTESCNDPRGYDVWADTAPGLQAATLYVDGAAIRFSDDGHTLISRAAAAGVRSHALKLDPAGQTLGAISLRIVSR